MDRHDTKLLGEMSETTYIFAKSRSQEMRMFDMFKKGMLVRDFRAYSMKGGGKSVTYRWAYKLATPAEAVAS